MDSLGLAYGPEKTGKISISIGDFSKYSLFWDRSEVLIIEKIHMSLANVITMTYNQSLLKKKKTRTHLEGDQVYLRGAPEEGLGRGVRGGSGLKCQ